MKFVKRKFYFYLLLTLTIIYNNSLISQMNFSMTVILCSFVIPSLLIPVVLFYYIINLSRKLYIFLIKIFLDYLNVCTTISDHINYRISFNNNS